MIKVCTTAVYKYKLTKDPDGHEQRGCEQLLGEGDLSKALT